MGNTLRVALIVIGIGMIGFGLYLWFFPNSTFFDVFKVEQENTGSQIKAMIAFGMLALIGGIAYKRR